MRILFISIFFALLLIKIYGYAKVDITKVEQINGDIHQQSKSQTSNISSLKIQKFVLTESQNNRVLYKIASSEAERIREKVFNLNLIKATYNLHGSNQLHVSADHGTIDQNKQIMYLESAINVSGNQYNLQAKKLEMALDKSYIHVEDSVRLNYNNSSIKGNECIIFNDSKNVRCNGNVQANIVFDGL